LAFWTWPLALGGIRTLGKPFIVINAKKHQFRAKNARKRHILDTWQCSASCESKLTLRAW
jgi:hypothetical protein